MAESTEETLTGSVFIKINSFDDQGKTSIQHPLSFLEKQMIISTFLKDNTPLYQWKLENLVTEEETCASLTLVGS